MRINQKAAPRQRGVILKNLLGKKFVWVLGLLTLSILAITFLQTPLFALKAFRCKTQYGPCSKIDEEHLKHALGENLFFYDTRDLVQSLRQVYLNRTVYIEKIFPNTISATIEKRKAIIAVKTAQKKELFLIDKDGEVIDMADESFLPTLVLENEELLVGKRLTEENVLQAKIFYLVYKAEKIRQAKIEGEKLIMQTADAVNVYFSTSRDARVAVGALQLILKQARIEGKLPKLIDLRYSKPILTYGQIESSSGD